MSEFEDRLTRELASFDDDAGPRVDVAGVRRVATRERRRRQGFIVGAVAAAVALVVGLTVVPQRAQGPEPATGPVEGALRLAWADDDGTVHLPSGRTVQVDGLTGLVGRAGTVLVGTGVPGLQTWSLVDDSPGAGGPALVPLDGAQDAPRVALDGSHVAWVDRAGAGDREGSVIVSRQATGPAVGAQSSLRIGVGRGPGSVPFALDVDDRGRVLLVTRSDMLLWTPGAQPKPLFGAKGAGGLGLLLDGRATVLDGPQPGSQLAQVGDSGVVRLVGESWGTTAYYFNDTATAFVGQSESRGPLALVTLEPGSSTSSRGVLPLPGGPAGLGEWAPLGWESETDVILGDGSTTLQRCSVPTNTCEPVPPTEGLAMMIRP